MDQHKMDKYEHAAVTVPAFQDTHQEVMEMFGRIVAGRATLAERQRYLAAWEHASVSVPETAPRALRFRRLAPRRTRR